MKAKIYTGVFLVAQCAATFVEGFQSKILASVCLAIGKLPPLPKAPPATITVLHAGCGLELGHGGLVPVVKQSYDVILNPIKGNSVFLANSIMDDTLTGDLGRATPTSTR